MKYSQETNGWYPDDTSEYSYIPDDLIQVTDEDYLSLFQFQLTVVGGKVVKQIDTFTEAQKNETLLAQMPGLTRRQFRLTLAMNGYDLKEVESLIDGIEDPMQRTIALIEWQDATDFERTNPTLLMMAGLLGLDTAAVDQLWEYGLML